MPETNRSDEHEPTEPAAPDSPLPDSPEMDTEAETEAPISVRDRWWWSPTLSIVLGFAVVAYQWGPLTGHDGIFLNWVVAGIGVAVAGVGAVRLARAYPR